MSQFRTKAQKAASKLKQIRSEQEMRYVSEQLKGYDSQQAVGTPKHSMDRMSAMREYILEAKNIKDLSRRRA